MRKLLSFLFMSFLSLLVLVSCGGNNKEIKEVFNNIGSSLFKDNGLSICVDQRYKVDTLTDTETENIQGSINYYSSTQYTLLVDGVDINNDDELDFYNYLSNKNGYVEADISEYVTNESSKILKSSNEEIKDNYSYRFEREFKSIFDDNELKIDSNSYYQKTYLDPYSSTSDSRRLKSKISKPLIVSKLSRYNLYSFMNKVVFSDTFYLPSLVDSYIGSMFREASKLSDGEFNKFVSDNNIVKKHDNYLNKDKINFNIDPKPLAKQLFGVDLKNNPDVYGTFYYDNDKHITDIDYYLADLLSSVYKMNTNKEVNVRVDDYHIICNSFTDTTDSYNDKFFYQYNEYTEPHTFINDVKENVTSFDNYIFGTQFLNKITFL